MSDDIQPTHEAPPPGPVTLPSPPGVEPAAAPATPRANAQLIYGPLPPGTVLARVKPGHSVWARPRPHAEGFELPPSVMHQGGDVLHVTAVTFSEEHMELVDPKDWKHVEKAVLARRKKIAEAKELAAQGEENIKNERLAAAIAAAMASSQASQPPQPLQTLPAGVDPEEFQAALALVREGRPAKRGPGRPRKTDT